MPNNLLFSDQFDSIPENQITENIAKNSYFSYEKAINPEIIDKMLSETELYKINFNSSAVASVHSDEGYFNSNAITKSHTVFKFLTSKKIFGIARSYLGNEFRLKCHRIYSLSPLTRQGWHTDNRKTGDGNIIKINGLVFIVYLNDVFNGEFQAIKGSHLISENYKYADYNDDVIKDYSKDIVSFKLPLGSMVIIDIKTIHRAKPYFNLFWRRKSLFFQIDNNIDNAEKALINPRFINNIDKTLFTYLGMGKKNDMPQEPATSEIKTLNLKNIIIVQGKVLLAIFCRINWLLKALVNVEKIKKIIKKFLKIKQQINTK